MAIPINVVVSGVMGFAKLAEELIAAYKSKEIDGAEFLRRWDNMRNDLNGANRRWLQAGINPDVVEVHSGVDEDGSAIIPVAEKKKAASSP